MQLTKGLKDNKIYTLKNKKEDVKLRVFLLFIGIVALACGVKFIYDARPIVKKYFSFGDKNEATSGLKILGFLLVILGGCLIYFMY